MINTKEVFFYKEVIDNTPVKLLITCPEGFCSYVNKEWRTYTGQTGDNAMGDKWLDALHPEDRKTCKKIFDDANIANKPFRLLYRLKRMASGKYRWHLALGHPRFTANGEFEGYISAVIDIHQQKKNEEMLQKSKNWYEEYAEAMPQMAFVADREGNIIFYNQRWYEYVNGLEGTEGWGWKDKPIHHPDDIQRTLETWNHSLKTGELYEIEYRLRKYNGEYRWFLGRATPIRDSEGDVIRWLGTNTDIHNQKIAEVELERTNEELRKKNEKLERMNQLHKNLVRVIAHDLRGPIGNMQLAFELLEKIHEPEKRDKILRGLEDMVERQKKVTDGLLDVIQAQSPDQIKASDIDLQQLVNNIQKEIKNRLENSGGIIETDFSDVSNICYNESFLHSIIKNLVTNSIKYTHKEVVPKIHITCHKHKEHVLIKVSDNGIGIDLETQMNRLFKPFERLTEVAEGNGIGLYIIKNLIEENDGFIKVESTPGEGTIFKCFLKEYDC